MERRRGMTRAKEGVGEERWGDWWLWSLDDGDWDSCDESRECWVELLRNLDANVDNERLALRASFPGRRRSVNISLGCCPGCGLSVDLRCGGSGKAVTRGWRGWKTSSRGTDSPRSRVAFSNCRLRNSASGTSIGVSGGVPNSDEVGDRMATGGRERGERGDRVSQLEPRAWGGGVGSSLLDPDEEVDLIEGEDEEDCE